MNWRAVVGTIVMGSARWARRVAGFTWVMISVSVASLYLGVPEARDRIARDWQERAIGMGIPTIHDTRIYRAASTVALVVMLILWVVCAELTVLVLQLIF